MTVNSISRNKKECMYNGTRFWVETPTGNALFSCGVVTTSYGVIAFDNTKTIFNYKGVKGLTCEYATNHRYEKIDGKIYDTIEITKELYAVQKGKVIRLSKETIFKK